MNAVYIHIPFCKSKCFYCDFNSYDNKNEIVDAYFNALKKEIENFTFNEKLNTIYIGGGTPSYVPAEMISNVLSLLPCAKEVTIEMNPDSVSLDKLLAYKKSGINRLSIGLQAVQDNILKEIGRIHTFNDFCNAYDLCRRCGFENINVDLMSGLPCQSLDDFKNGVDTLIKYKPEHISCYSLILHNHHFDNLPSDDAEREMYYYAKEQFIKNGYKHYEISNFALPGFESKHNLVYWNQEEYRGFGAGASSYIDGKRFTNILNLEEYIRRINNDEQSFEIEEVQDIEGKIREFIILKLRLIEGFGIDEINKKFKIDVLEKYKDSWEKLLKMELIEINDRIFLTSKGLDLANIVWEEFV